MPVILLIVSILIFSLVAVKQDFFNFLKNNYAPVQNLTLSSPVPSPSFAITLKPLPQFKILPNGYHTFQTFNNCGPAALSMALSYYGINVGQQQLGEELRPYQNPQGDNDDKSVTLEEISEISKDYNLTAYHRTNGNTDLIKNFINYDIPIIARTWTKANEDIGHYRVIKGYDQSIQSIIQDDSLQNKNLWYKYNDFAAIWGKFNFEYLVLVPKDKLGIAEVILGEDANEKIAWQKAVDTSSKILSQNPNDATARFNLSVALYHTGEFQKSVNEFEKVENRLPFRTLWYQIEPIQAYFELGNYERVFAITDRILNNYNRAFSELYLIRGEIYLKQGNIAAAKSEFQKAVLYNKNLESAKEALNKVD